MRTFLGACLLVASPLVFLFMMIGGAAMFGDVSLFKAAIFTSVPMFILGYILVWKPGEKAQETLPYAHLDKLHREMDEPKSE